MQVSCSLYVGSSTNFKELPRLVELLREWLSAKGCWVGKRSASTTAEPGDAGQVGAGFCFSPMISKDFLQH